MNAASTSSAGQTEPVDRRVRRRELRPRHITSAVLVMLMFVALLGAAGGRVSEVTVSGGEVTVVSDRFVRSGEAQQLLVRVHDAAAAAGDGPVLVVLSQELLGDAELTDVRPKPVRVVERRHDVLFTFPSATPLTVTFTLMSHGLGPVRG